MYQTVKDDFIIRRSKELREQNRKAGRTVSKWDIFRQAKDEWEAAQSQQTSEQSSVDTRDTSELETRLQTVSDEYWSLLRRYNQMKTNMDAALSLLEQCSFTAPLSREDYLNQSAVQKALEQLHGVIKADR